VPHTSLSKVFAIVSLGILVGIGSAHSQAADCTHSALVKGEEGRYNIVLENNCSAPVKWSYNACVIGQSVEDGIVTVGSGQTFQTGFTHTGIGTPNLLEDSCSGMCLTSLLTCSVSSALTPSSDTLIEPSVLFPKNETPAEPQAQLKPLSELMVEKPASESSTSIYDSLMDGIEPSQQSETELKPLDELLAEKPSPAQPKPVITPARGVTPKINAQTLPSNIGVKPVTPLPSVDAKVPNTDAIAACVSSELKPRNFRGQAKLELSNHCPQPQNVAARICIAGQTDTIKIIQLKSEGKDSASFPLPKNMTPRLRMASCQGANCTPRTPQSCN
tara:strand:+ start:136490 stop:137482 length:993 start_codon:yes stop_codon:yes gene_type:complete